jgi:hypothetical protein
MEMKMCLLSTRMSCACSPSMSRLFKMPLMHPWDSTSHRSPTMHWTSRTTTNTSQRETMLRMLGWIEGLQWIMSPKAIELRRMWVPLPPSLSTEQGLEQTPQVTTMGVDSHVRVLTQGVMLDGSPEIRGMPQGQILGVDLGEDRSDLI